jgi:hypothetical protein
MTFEIGDPIKFDTPSSRSVPTSPISCSKSLSTAFSTLGLLGFSPSISFFEDKEEMDSRRLISTVKSCFSVEGGRVALDSLTSGPTFTYQIRLTKRM